MNRRTAMRQRIFFLLRRHCTTFLKPRSPVNSLSTCLPLVRLARAPLIQNLTLDFFLVKYMPSWMPGASFKHFAAKSKQTNQELLDRPLEAVKTRLVSFHISESSEHIIPYTLHVSYSSVLQAR